MKSIPALFALLIFPAPVLSAERPNVVVFLVDDMGVMDSSVPFLTDSDGKPRRYPLNDFYRTPNMQRLANQGVRFSQFYAMSVCSPTRASILTGQNAARHHTTQWISPEKNNRGNFGPPNWNWEGLGSHSVTLPRLLQTAGYTTIHVGKGHFGPFTSEGDDPTNLGFDINVGGRAIGAPGSYFGADHYGNPIEGHQPKKKDRAVPHLEKYHGTQTHLTDALTTEALRHVTESVKSETPFFLYLAHYAVHSPHQSDPRFADHYKNADYPQRVQNFATLIEGMDQSLGDVMDRVHDLGVGENTLILFLGDNGSDAAIGHEHAVACAAPLRGKKGSHYEGGVRVPFIAAWAKPNADHTSQQAMPIARGKIHPQIANVCDVLPTIAGITGIQVPESHPVDGESLKSMLAGQNDDDHRDQFLLHFPHEHRSSYYSTLRVGDWKVAYHYLPGEDSGGKRYQLFNLATDPFEQNDLSKQEPKQLLKLLRELDGELDSHSAQFPVKDGNSLNIVLNPMLSE